MEDRSVVCEEDFTTGNGDGVLGTEEHEDQQWLTGMRCTRYLFSLSS